MALRIPQRDVGDWCKEIIDQCTASRDSRREQIKQWKNYYTSGTETGDQARYNRCYGHVDRLASYLFSPADVRFDIELRGTAGDEDLVIAEECTDFLNEEFSRCAIDTYFSQAVTWALVKGMCIVKLVWGHDGLEPWLVHPEFFGVLNETVNDLDRQEAFTHTSYILDSELERQLTDHPKATEIMNEVKQGTESQRERDVFEDSFFHQILIGGIKPISVTGVSSGQGSVAVAPNVPMLSAQVARRLIRVEELWVNDIERQDWTTLRVAYPNIVMEGRLKRRNLCFSGASDETGAKRRGEHPFRVVCPNETDGYFWGSSEMIQISPLQDLLNGQLRDFTRLTRLKSDPPRAMIGFSGMTLEKYRAARRPGGFISEDTPNAKVENLAPEIPPELLTGIEKTTQFFDDVAGFTPILSGVGDQGMRSGVQAQTATRNASPRLRDRALLVEKQCVDVGDLAFKILQAQEAELFLSSKKERFLLSQLSEDHRISVDSHTSSPAFSEDNERKAFTLARYGAIDHSDLIWLTHPPHQSTLRRRARERAQMEAKMLAEHPELLTKKGKRK